MGQQDILNLLQKGNKPMSAKEIAGKLKIGNSSAGIILKKLVSQGNIYYIEVGTNSTRFYYIKYSRKGGYY